MLLVLLPTTTSLFPTVAAAQESPQSVIQRVEARYRSVTTMKAKVTQTRQDAFGSETLSGELLVKRPSKLRWKLGDKLFVSNGSKMWIYAPSENQVIVYNDVASRQAEAESFLTSMDKLTANFNVSVVSSTASGVQLRLAPKSGGQFKSAEIYLNGKLDVYLVQIVDAFDNRTTMSFSGMQFNVAADDAQFNFTPPAGVKVVSATP
jgi:chaperone LolA